MNCAKNWQRDKNLFVPLILLTLTHMSQTNIPGNGLHGWHDQALFGATLPELSNQWMTFLDTRIFILTIMSH